MDLGIAGKTALVLASSKGLGRAVATTLFKEGADVIICGTDAEALKATEQDIKKQGAGKIMSVTCDLTVPADRKNLFEQAFYSFGKVDILVTNTGGPPAGPFEQFSLGDWENFYNLIFLSAVDMIQQVLPGMKARNHGRILAITSVAVKQPADNLIASNAVRTAMLGLVKSLAGEVAPYGITVNNLMPGYTETNRLKSLVEQNPAVLKIKETIPMQRFGTPEEFASAAAFLVSEQASYITGQSLAVDGGWIKGH